MEEDYDMIRSCFSKKWFSFDWKVIFIHTELVWNVLPSCAKWGIRFNIGRDTKELRLIYNPCLPVQCATAQSRCIRYQRDIAHHKNGLFLLLRQLFTFPCIRNANGRNFQLIRIFYYKARNWQPLSAETNHTLICRWFHLISVSSSVWIYSYTIEAAIIVGSSL